MKQCSVKKEELYECVKCELLFRNYDMYVQHKQAHEKESKNDDMCLKCSLCSFQINNSIEYFNHLLTVHNLNLAPLLQFSTQVASGSF